MKPLITPEEAIELLKQECPPGSSIAGRIHMIMKLLDPSSNTPKCPECNRPYEDDSCDH